MSYFNKLSVATALMVSVISLGASADYQCSATSSGGKYRFIVWGKDLNHLRIQISEKDSNGSFVSKANFELPKAGAQKEQFRRTVDGEISLEYGYSFNAKGRFGFGWYVNAALIENEMGVLYLRINPASDGKFGGKITARTRSSAGDTCVGPTLPN